MSERIRKAACVGAGVIGAGWAARYLWNGIDVAVHDPHPEARRRCEEVITNADRALQRLWGRPPLHRGTLTFPDTLAAAVDGADIVQESAPEQEELKRRLLADIDRHTPAETVIGSSTSGLLPSRLQGDMTHPERFLVTHPFNPVYLLPLVELCGGERTSSRVVERARGIYDSVGMQPLHVRKEIDGFVADRLLEALWREALWLVHDEVATVEEVDDAVRFGAGLRWALMGSFMTYRIAGGEDGMRHFMAQFGPALKWPWTKLMDVPELTDGFIDRIGEQSDAQAGDRSIRTLERQRDDGLVAILQALRHEGLGAGNVLARHDAEQQDRAPSAVDIDAPAPLVLIEATVSPAAVDYNDHMTESQYLEFFGRAGTELFRLLGMDQSYVDAGASFFTVESHLVHLNEIRVDEPFRVTTQVLSVDDKRIHAFHRMHHGDTDELLASGEQMYLHVDTRAGRAVPAPANIRELMDRVARAHADLEQPSQAGRAIRPLS